DIRRDHVILVGYDKYVVVGVDGEGGIDAWLLARGDDADIVTSATGDVLVLALIDDRGAEPPGGASDRVGISGIARRRAVHQEPVGPFLDHEILGKRVGQHVAVRHHVH